MLNYQRLGILTLVAGLTACATSYRQSGPSNLSNLDPNKTITSDLEAREDLMREQNQNGVSVYAMPYTAPYLRAYMSNQGAKEGISASQLEPKIQASIKTWVEDKTVFTLEIAGYSLDSINFKYWGATVIDADGKEYPAQLDPNPTARHYQQKTYTARRQYGTNQAAVNETVTGDRYDQTGTITVPHLDLTRGVRLKLQPRYQKDLPAYTLSWDPPGGPVNAKENPEKPKAQAPDVVAPY